MARLFQVIRALKVLPRRADSLPVRSPGFSRSGVPIETLLGLACFFIFVLAPVSSLAEPAKSPKPKPAKLQISGYGFLGNHGLKRMLQTLELAGKKPTFFSASFVEDAALILASRVKRDGY